MGDITMKLRLIWMFRHGDLDAEQFQGMLEPMGRLLVFRIAVRRHLFLGPVGLDQVQRGVHLEEGMGDITMELRPIWMFLCQRGLQEACVPSTHSHDHGKEHYFAIHDLYFAIHDLFLSGLRS